MKDLFGNEELGSSQKKKSKKSDYAAFVDKFDKKLTTDDCYTPPHVYEAVLNWVKSHIPNIDGCIVQRPFKPNGDYISESLSYSDQDVVVDNPPFSILSSIKRYYSEHNIRFFLFAPHLTIFSGYLDGICCLPTGNLITYKNGARVVTSFVTNMLPHLKIYTAPELYEAIDRAQIGYKDSGKELPKYIYPMSIATQERMHRLSKNGISFSVESNESLRIGRLDAQIPFGKAIFGSAYLLTENKKLDLTQALNDADISEAKRRDLRETHIFELSEREIYILKELANNDKTRI